MAREAMSLRGVRVFGWIEGMETLPQPPPDVPAPEAERSRRKMVTTIVTGAVCALVFGVLAIPAPMMYVRMKKANRVEATSNLKQIFPPLLEFEVKYGRFPDVTTISSVHARNHTSMILGTATSNDMFRQLFVDGLVVNEGIFWAKTATPRKPDGIFSGADALKKGECSFAYVAGLSLADDPEAPLAMAPLISGTREFDPKPLNGKAVVLRVDGSVREEIIDQFGHVMIRGKNIFDPAQPYWKGKMPDIKYPE